ncbi:hypothetical protein BU16DRAFT_318309 [Lophium mytilinum]|uniref:Uncharacterized protein n=1 Tax=Lophium mytilinum TaxID=390894 RepID=A0A6A6QZP8_9PEZI|nr:hypothetical protein BU16DRAFT_318309 [Lophium mytilinum]
MHMSCRPSKIDLSRQHPSLPKRLISLNCRCAPSCSSPSLFPCATPLRRRCLFHQTCLLLRLPFGFLSAFFLCRLCWTSVLLQPSIDMVKL